MEQARIRSALSLWASNKPTESHISQIKQINAEPRKEPMTITEIINTDKNFLEHLWEKRVQELEAEGCTTSDAQSIADAEMEKNATWGWAKE